MKQYLKLLMVREGKEVLGKHYSNLWLLTVVLIATFISIAFSEGSMIYLRDKMEDPFTNWIDIPTNGSGLRHKAFLEELKKPEIQEKYGFTDVHEDREHYYDMIGLKDMFVKCRHFADINSPLVRKILNDDNIVNGIIAEESKIYEKSLGVIITADALKRMGFGLDSIPSYISFKAFNPDADTLGIGIIDHKFVPAPWPILAVVRRLPGNADMMGTNYLSEQPMNDKEYPFDFAYHTEYLRQLTFFVPDNLSNQQILSAVNNALPDSLKGEATIQLNPIDNMQTWMKGRHIEVVIKQGETELPIRQWISISDNVIEELGDKGLVRIYNYATSSSYDVSSYLSLTFTTLEHIREFESFAKSEFQVQIDMSLVASKENFNAVTTMARILSGAMVIFAIVCIIMFLVNMLQSYFQKVKRNIGTFKAFGMNAMELILVYVLILIMIVCSAVVISLLFAWGIQTLLSLIGMEKDGFNYLCVWNPMTYVATVIIIVSTVFTVVSVMVNMLSRTPGDLIYDR